MTLASIIASGLKGFPECTECQCYPECRIDCPDHFECVQRLPVYEEAVRRAHVRRTFGQDTQ